MPHLLFVAVQVLYLFAPLLLSALFAGIIQRHDWLRSLRKPIDAGLTVRGKRLFGGSKTWRGVTIAAAGCVIGTALQKYLLSPWCSSVELIDYAQLEPLVFGVALGGGAMLGELPNSFVKRQLGIPPGGSAAGWKAFWFYVWDQVDVITTAWPSIALWIRPEPMLVAMSFALALSVHPFVSLLGYLMGARKTIR